MYKGKQPLKKTTQNSLTSKPTVTSSKSQIKPKVTSQKPTFQENTVNPIFNQPTKPSVKISKKSMTSSFAPKPRMPMAMEVHQELFPCKECGRTFIAETLPRHQKICKKIFTNKRKEFNSAKQRFTSKEQMNIYKKNRTFFNT